MTDVKSDPDLGPDEKEMTIRVAADEDKITVHSDIPSVTRALLSRDDAEIVSRRQIGDEIVAAKVKLPLGVLKIQENAREHGKFGKVVSSHD